MNRNQPIFVRNDDKYFITDKDAQKWDQEQHNPEETRLPTLMELEEKDRLVLHLKMMCTKMIYKAKKDDQPCVILK